jgi:hypothetical protein
MRLAWLCGWLALGVTSLSAFAGEGSSRRGSGTEADPYQIGTVEQLQGMKDDLAACYVLVNDLDASGTAAWDGGKGFSPVGDPAHPFTGTFDGRGHAIDGLKIDRFGHITTHIALFGCTGERALIRNVSVRKAFVKGCDCVGILVGVNQGTVSNAYVSGEVYGSGTFGGLVGGHSKGLLSHCSAAVVVGPVWVGNHLGGLAGSNNGGTISDCFATGTVTGQENPGGLVGVNNGGFIRRCYASGNVASSFGGASDSYRRGAGGLVAQNQAGGSINDCFATGTVTGPGGLPVGGLVGMNADKAVVSNSYTLAGRDNALPGVGKNYPGAGLAECEGVTAIGAAFFKPRSGPLECWGTDGLWDWALDDGPVNLPRFTSAFCGVRSGKQSAVQAGVPTAVVDLEDGSRIVGVPAVAEIEIVSPLGRIRLPLKTIARMEFNADRETVVISLANGDRLSGVPALESLKIDTAWAKISVELRHIRLLTVSKPVQE